MEEKFYTVNEFAKFCETSKSTLLVYDRKGLLKPAKIGENGYRYYTLNQFYDYYVIKALQTAGSSLAEIAAQLKSCDNKKLFTLLKAKRSELGQKQFELMRMQQFIDHMLSQEETTEYSSGKIRTEELSEEYFIAMPTETEYVKFSPPEERHCIDAILKLNRYVKERGYANNILFDSGYIVSGKVISKGLFRPTHYYCKIPFKTNDTYLHIKPAGTYISYYVKGSYYDLAEQYERLQKILLDRGYKVDGDCYISNLTASVLTFSESNTVRIISVRVV